MVDSQDRPITYKQLTWAETAQLVWWKLKHNTAPLNRPRASWAQILMAFGIRDTRCLVYQRADADIIPSSVDAPIQRIKLFDLGMLALYLGFKKVTVNTREREFEAVGDFGTITTLKNTELGKVLQFEGDILAIYAQISKESIKIHSDPALGQISFAPGITPNGIICPLHLLTRVIAEHWESERFEEEQRTYLESVQEAEGFAKGHISAEAPLFAVLYRNPTLLLTSISTGTDTSEFEMGNDEHVQQHPLFFDVGVLGWKLKWRPSN